MSMHKKLATGLLLAMTLPLYALASTALNTDAELQASPPSTPQEGKEYITLTNPVASQPKVVEFFSFYCSPCHQFVDNYPVADAINRFLPADDAVVKYHVSTMGPLGKELTEAWAIAMVMGKTHLVEKPLFEAVQNRKLQNITDIQTIFSQAGIDTATYEQARQSLMVKGAIAQQNAAVVSFAVRGTPSFYVNGKYQINNAGIAAPTPQRYVNNFAEVVQTLLKNNVAI